MTTAEHPRRTVAAARLVIADDHPLYRAGIVRALVESDRFTVVGEAGDGQTAYELIVRLRPDLAILDSRMPGLDGLSLLSRLRAERNPLPVLIVSAFTAPAVVDYALALGAAGFVNKAADRRELVATATAIVDRREIARPPVERDGPLLLPTERLILALLHDGWSPSDVPYILGIDRAAAERYLRDAAARLGVDGPREAVASALAWGLLE